MALDSTSNVITPNVLNSDFFCYDKIKSQKKTNISYNIPILVGGDMGRRVMGKGGNDAIRESRQGNKNHMHHVVQDLMKNLGLLH